MEIHDIFVVGAGFMGSGIAQTAIQKGYHVTLNDQRSDALERAKAGIRARLDRLVAKERMTAEEVEACMGRLTISTSLEGAAHAGLAIEAIYEDLEAKKAVFRQLDQICDPSTILASNTSSISITAIAAATQRPDKFIGMHFFNPATVMKLVEVIRGAHTSDETYNTIAELAKAIGKEPVEVNEAPGFVVNKILIPMINEACDLVYTGVASVEGVDTAMKLGANHPMGPLALGDLVGLDVCLAIMDTLYNETHDPKYRASLLMRKMVRASKLGRKTGIGFYDYSKK